jgi:flagellar biosynthetic protein FliQ
MDAAPGELLQSALAVAFWVSLPVLLVALAVGVITAIVQAGTQVQDSAVSAVPKLVACAVALLAVAGWMVARLVDFAQDLFAFAGVP